LFGIETSPSTADRALLLATRAWGDPGTVDRFDRFAPDWGKALRTSWPRFSTVTPREAREALRRDHEGSARPDLGRIHPSWLLRASRAESPAVRRAITTHSPPPVGEMILRGLGRDRSSPGPGPGPGLTPDPEAVGWALTLWTERLVGDVADRADDPPVVVAITRMRPREVARLIKVCGQVKHAFAIEGQGPSKDDEALVRMSVLDRVRIAFFRRWIGAADPRLVPAARRDLEVIGPDRRRGHSRLGLLTFGRLLDSAEPHRARWAMQHLPYPVVKQMREKAESPLSTRALAAWESWVLESAWARLLSEGRLSGNRGDRS
jgi:hypothetical protein